MKQENFRRVYLDNAATTSMDAAVVDAMTHAMQTYFGNPSSIHAHGREAKSQLESARKRIATRIHCAPSEILFTSGGTEADNTALACTIRDLGINHVITSPLEHHAVLHTLEAFNKRNEIACSYVAIHEDGSINLSDLERLLTLHPGCLVSLMHANNETGCLTDIKAVGDLCVKYKSLFHSDTVQTVGHLPINVKEIPVHFITGAAHKFHGPKGIGFLYTSNQIKIGPFVNGGAQERNMRGGTENLYGIVGMAKALETACERYPDDQAYIFGLKQYMISQIAENFPDARFNGPTAIEKSLYTILNVSFAENERGEMLLFSLDINGISASSGSACSSGSEVGSHVLRAMKISPERVNIRFSFSKYTTIDDIDFTMARLKELIPAQPVSV